MFEPLTQCLVARAGEASAVFAVGELLDDVLVELFLVEDDGVDGRVFCNAGNRVIDAD